MNYTQLTQLVQDYLQNSGTTFTSNIDRFIRQAEERIFRDVTVPALRKEATGTLTASTDTITVPSDFLTMISLEITVGSYDRVLLPKQEDFLDEAYKNSSLESSPEYYALQDGTTVRLAPTPDSNYSYTMKYFYDPDSIVDSSTSWLGNNAETALLYGTLVEAYTFEKGEIEVMNQYEERYGTALRGLSDLGMVRLKGDEFRNTDRKR